MKRNQLFLLLLVISLCSCTTKRKYAESVTRMQAENAALEQQLAESDLSSDKEAPQVEERKIVYSANMYMKADDPDSTAEKIGQLAKSYKGYVQTTGTRKVIIRVPSSSFEAALSGVIKLGEVENKVVKGQDVTEQYLDLEIRLDNAEKARQRYLQLLEKSENVSEALKVERELERISKEIDLLKGKINRLSNLTTFATIEVNFLNEIEEEKVKPGPLGYVFVGLYKGIKWLFVRN